jgi:hypothetical protein
MFLMIKNQTAKSDTGGIAKMALKLCRPLLSFYDKRHFSVPCLGLPFPTNCRRCKAPDILHCGWSAVCLIMFRPSLLPGGKHTQQAYLCPVISISPQHITPAHFITHLSITVNLIL